ncbi:MAG TPA: hypothetical protein VGY97_04905, partial [Solirubrobacteraceae bacterium]|nr:hypothetical protein [Solirubrobacteraceae bacterium]
MSTQTSHPGALRSQARFPDVPRDRAHYESFYLKASHPSEPIAFWIRHTVFKAPGERPIGSLWCTLFDAGRPGPLAGKVTLPPDELHAGPDTYVRIGSSELVPGRASGQAESDRRRASWELTFKEGPEPFPYFPRPWMYRARVPRTKAILLYPSAVFSGRLIIDGEELDVNEWLGMIGHNWGSEHPERGIWLRGDGFTGEPHAWLDAVVGRVRVGPVVTPWLGNGCLYLDGARHRVGGPRPGAVEIDEKPTSCAFVLHGDGLVVRGTVEADPERFVGWVYSNPGGGPHPTLNCSIADMTLTVERPGLPDTTLKASGRAAYELQLRERDHGIPIQ